MRTARVSFPVEGILRGCTYTVEVETIDAREVPPRDAIVSIQDLYITNQGWIMYNVLFDDQPMVMTQPRGLIAVIYNTSHNTDERCND